MNYQRSCRGACYQQGTPSQRMVSRYPRGNYEPVAGVNTGMSRGMSASADFKLPIATSLAMVYSPMQMWRDIYEIDCALERGTLFAELDKPLLSAGR